MGSTIGILAFILNIKFNEKLINLSDYPYPSPKNNKYDYVLIAETTDIHGYGFDRVIPSNSDNPYMKNKGYSYGGGSLFYSYLKALKLEFGKKNVLYFDAGDKFQGGLESTLSNGTIMTELSNEQNLNADIFGNHEFDNGMEFLKIQMNKSKFDWITTNLIDKNTNNSKFLNDTKNYVEYKIFKISEKIKIGVIGYTPNFNYYTYVSGIENIKFLKYNDYIKQKAKYLREKEKVNAVILLIHNGIPCKNDIQKINIWSKNDTLNDENCIIDNDGLYEFLINLEKGIIDAVLGGHVHYPSHHFFNGIPLIHNKDRGVHFHILYLPFDKKNGKLNNDEIKIEGPIPICNLISEKNKECGYSERFDNMYNFYFHNYRIRFNEKIDKKVLKKYKNNFSKYKKFLCYNEDGIYERGVNETLVGNMNCDAIRDSVNSDFAILNNGAFRSVWYPGNIYLEDVYNMYPFRSTVVTFEISGNDLYDIIEITRNNLKSINCISGFREFIKKNENGKYIVDKLVFMNGTLIDKNKIYTVATNEFLADGGDNFDLVKDKLKNIKHNLEIKEAIENYLLKVKVLKKENYYASDPAERRIVFE